jgi:antitoxin (DNA-binding transcriptional repressor) of toxin-antitoxin stability system
MVQVRMTEAEAAQDFHAVLLRVREGAEVVIEEGHRRIALITPVEGPGRSIDECIAILEAHGSGAALDEDFGKDLGKVLSERKPIDSSAWE